MSDPLESELGLKLDQQEGDLRVTVNYLHPSTASETDFLFGRPFRGRAQRKRRKRVHAIDVGDCSAQISLLLVIKPSMATPLAPDRFGLLYVQWSNSMHWSGTEFDPLELA